MTFLAVVFVLYIYTANVSSFIYSYKPSAASRLRLSMSDKPAPPGAGRPAGKVSLGSCEEAGTCRVIRGNFKAEMNARRQKKRAEREAARAEAGEDEDVGFEMMAPSSTPKKSYSPFKKATGPA